MCVCVCFFFCSEYAYVQGDVKEDVYMFVCLPSMYGKVSMYIYFFAAIVVHSVCFFFSFFFLPAFCIKALCSVRFAHYLFI